MPRYFLNSLLMLGIPAAAGAAYFARHSRLGGVVVLAAAVTLYFTPAHVNTWESVVFNWAAAKRRLVDLNDDCRLTAGHMIGYCAAHRAINTAANDASTEHSRVLVFSWYRLWLRPEHLSSTNTMEETVEIEKSKTAWELVRRKGFRFVLLDTNFAQTKVLKNDMALAGGLKELYRDATLTAYELLP